MLNGVTSLKTITLIKLQTAVCICVIDGMVIWDNVLNKLVRKSELGGNGLGHDLGTNFCDYYDESSNLSTSSIIFMCCRQLLYHAVNTDL